MEIVGTILAAIVSAVAGHFPAYCVVKYYTRRVDKATPTPKDCEANTGDEKLRREEAEKLKRDLKRDLTSWIGVAERVIVTLLVIWDPTATQVFIGGWVILKFAGGWKRFTEPSDRNRAIYQAAILGNVTSLGIAVMVGIAYHAFCASP
jgi:hypothetical protein